MKTDKEQLIQEVELANSSLTPELKTMKYEKMLASPFTFFRATNHLFWKKYSTDKRIENFGANLNTWLQGDSHVYNFGIFHNSKGDIIYDINDFDETIIANYQFDLWRFAASLVLACKSETELSERKINVVVESFAEAYLNEMQAIIDGKSTDKTFLTEEGAFGILEEELKQVKKKGSRKKMLNKWTNNVDGVRVFDRSIDKLKRLPALQYNNIEQQLNTYFKTLDIYKQKGENHFKIKDVAQRLYSGLGSFGVPRYYVLLEGDTAKGNDDVILDVKWQSKPSAYHYLSSDEQAAYNTQYDNQGQRYQTSYKAMIKNTDPYLGCVNINNGDYAIREISPYKSFIPIEGLTKKKHYKQMVKHWAKIIAMYHALSHEQFDRKSFSTLTRGKSKDFSKLLLELAWEIANETSDNYVVFKTYCEEKYLF